jgi:hypothetical protein
MSKTWGTTCGVWGDVIVNYGYFLERIKEGKLLYLGNNNQIVEFLKCQPNVKDVIKVPIDEDEWQNYWLYTVFPQTMVNRLPDYKTTPREPFVKAGYNDFMVTHITNDDARIDKPIYQWHGVKLPKHVQEWAKDMAAQLPKEFYLFQPYSFNSNSPFDHWPYWDLLAKLITDRTNKKIVIIGHNWYKRAEEYSPTILGPRVISLYNQVPSMMHIFALARYAAGTITTSNSLAHWCQIDDLPCMVICNRKSSRPNYIFRRVLNWPTLAFCEYDDEPEYVYNKVSELVFGRRLYPV